MMKIGPMRMRMYDGFVLVPVRVFRRHLFCVSVCMMPIVVNVSVDMADRIMSVLVLVPSSDEGGNRDHKTRCSDPLDLCQSFTEDGP